MLYVACRTVVVAQMRNILDHRFPTFCFLAMKLKLNVSYGHNPVATPGQMRLPLPKCFTSFCFAKEISISLRGDSWLSIHTLGAECLSLKRELAIETAIDAFPMSVKQNYVGGCQLRRMPIFWEMMLSAHTSLPKSITRQELLTHSQRFPSANVSFDSRHASIMPWPEGSSRYIVPAPDSYGGTRDWRNIWVFVSN